MTQVESAKDSGHYLVFAKFPSFGPNRLLDFYGSRVAIYVRLKLQLQAKTEGSNTTVALNGFPWFSS